MKHSLRIRIFERVASERKVYPYDSPPNLVHYPLRVTEPRNFHDK